MKGEGTEQTVEQGGANRAPRISKTSVTTQ